MQDQSQQPPTTPEPKDEKQKCMICEALVARTFIDLGGRRIHLCQQDANTILRMACKLEAPAMTTTLKFVEEQIYGRELEETR
jgi:hypothetical protein